MEIHVFFKLEYLVWKGISSDAIVIILPAAGSTKEINIYLGKKEVSAVICNKAGGETPQLIYQWVVKDLWRTRDYRDSDMALRLVQGMYVKHDDNFRRVAQDKWV